MQQNTFYKHLVEIETIDAKLDDLHLSEKEKKDLMHHVHSSIHYTVLDVILTELPEDHKKIFIENVRFADHNKIWDHVKNNTVNIEEKIKQGIHLLSQEFLEEIEKIKTRA